MRFGYSPDKPVINDFSAKVSEGQTVAIVGPTGAGKTTMVKLLMRFYDVDGGAIRIGGVDARDFSRSDVRSMFGMVLQDTWLFSGTIRENIRYGKLDATDEEVEAAARAGCAHHFITTLPGGYDFVINEDATNISQGQRQLLTIARAILANRRMLILDEATSSVDTRTEERIQRAMDNLMEGRTSFVIAHRLSTIRSADLILVMQHGDIVEQGTHDELLARGGFMRNCTIRSSTKGRLLGRPCLLATRFSVECSWSALIILKFCRRPTVRSHRLPTHLTTRRPSCRKTGWSISPHSISMGPASRVTHRCF